MSLASDEHICYVQCGFCSTILLVSVPCSSRLISMVVAVECGHCNAILPAVNIIKQPCFLSLHLISSLNPQQIELPAAQPKCTSLSLSSESDDDVEEEEDSIEQFKKVIHKLPGKKQRAPSAYNQFMKEEIKRLKSEYPNLTHKQAFSAAAKNWAHYPQTRRGEVNA